MKIKKQIEFFRESIIIFASLKRLDKAKSRLREYEGLVFNLGFVAGMIVLAIIIVIFTTLY